MHDPTDATDSLYIPIVYDGDLGYTSVDSDTFNPNKPG